MRPRRVLRFADPQNARQRGGKVAHGRRFHPTEALGVPPPDPSNVALIAAMSGRPLTAWQAARAESAAIQLHPPLERDRRQRRRRGRQR
jgi:hypothetical protein